MQRYFYPKPRHACMVYPADIVYQVNSAGERNSEVSLRIPFPLVCLATLSQSDAPLKMHGRLHE